ncbi:General secretion pathway protein F [Limihaloglobus sulfuriphilus]|uniref:General secretion pathway protein F n=1 Tax=Limihaloglobus sulfuriphilus TaxID=1851148 RepID=A0A1R7T637_9BACT|nr:type II secretion system F family protein [Limihaloglobus sulfuriphilus]AQQ72253.1 General secretion pathway protein F [Limihaloglobus sulfuriphilus]
MPRYKYTAYDLNNKKVRGTLTAENSYAARKQVKTRSLTPISIKEITYKRSGFSLGRKTNKKQLMDFTKQLATLINSGIKLTEALSVLTSQVSDVKFRSVLTDIRDRVMTGESFAEGLSDYPEYFGVIYVNMVRVGEMTGSFGDSLLKIAGFMEKRAKFEGKIATALIYPVFLLLFGMVAFFFLTTFTIPKVAGEIRRSGQELPWITEFVMGLSDVLKSWKWMLAIFASIALLIYAYKRFTASEYGALVRDRLLLSIPVLNRVVKQTTVARFSSSLSTLLGAGLPMAESLRVVSEVTGNQVMNNAIKKARDRILSGADISTPLVESGVIDPTTAHMVAVGEKTGELEAMLKGISESFEADTDVLIDRINALVEPTIILGIAVMIGILASAMLLPMIQLSQAAL